METKDRKKTKKLLEENLHGASPNKATEPSDPYEDQTKGIVRIHRAANESDEEYHTLQEHHNANHALYYFSMITDGIVRGRTTGDDQEKIRRVKEHMMTLREFIGEDKAGVRTAVNSLLERFEKSSPVRRREFAKFIYENWSLILPFAEAYGHKERCFSEAKYQKLRDIVSGSCYIKAWWWELRWTRLVKSVKHFLKPILAKFNEKNEKAEKLVTAFFNNKMAVVNSILTLPKAKREPALVERTIHSIEDIFHHLCPKDDRLQNLFEELISILKKYPELTEEDCQKGKRIADELVKSFNGKALNAGETNG